MATPLPLIPASGQIELSADVNRIIDLFLQGAGRKRTRVDESENDENNEAAPADANSRTDYRDYGRRFARLGEPFSKIWTIVEHGLEIENMDTDDEDQGRIEDERQKQLSSDWRILCRIIPRFRDDAILLAEQRKLRRGVCLQINSGVDKARSDDTNGLKTHILNYLHHDPSVPLDPPILPSDPHKSLRGWNHPTTAALLTPIELDANEMTYAEVKSGRRRITADQMPRFLYPDGHVYSEENAEEGLFHGHVIIRAARHIFSGPGSVFEPPGYQRGRPSVGRVIEMTKMTSRALAYVAVQTRFAISDAPEWHVVNRHFNYEKFFWNIVKLLDGDEGQALLKFYDHEVLGILEDNPLQDISTNSLGTVSTFDRIMEQRAAKRARRDGPAMSQSV